MELFRNTVDLRLLYPPLAAELSSLLTAVFQKTGKRFLITEGFRSAGRSHQLNKESLKGGPRAAPAGMSFHNYGLAVDCVFDTDPRSNQLEPSWDADKYDVLVREVRNRGLHSGVSYLDSGHISWADWEQRKGFASQLLIEWNSSNAIGHIPRLQAVWSRAEKLAALL